MGTWGFLQQLKNVKSRYDPFCLMRCKSNKNNKTTTTNQHIIYYWRFKWFHNSIAIQSWPEPIWLFSSAASVNEGVKVDRYFKTLSFSKLVRQEAIDHSKPVSAVNVQLSYKMCQNLKFNNCSKLMFKSQMIKFCNKLKMTKS
jgi:hypothetical protein